MCEGGSALRADPGFTIYKIPVADYRPWFHNFPDFHPKVGIRRVMKPGKGGSDPELLMQESFIRRMWSLPHSDMQSLEKFLPDFLPVARNCRLSFDNPPNGGNPRIVAYLSADRLRVQLPNSGYLRIVAHSCPLAASDFHSRTVALFGLTMLIL